MGPVFIALVALVGSTFRTRSAMQAEIAALRHQLAVLQRSAPRRLHLKQSDRVLWILLSRLWPDWRHWLRILKPDTVVRWHRRGFARYWRWQSRRRPGRPPVASAVRDLIQQMCQANFLWGAPRIHGEILKLGIEVAPSTVGKYLRQRRKPPSQTWRTFLKNHMKQTASMDFFTVPTATFRVLFVFIVLSHDRRRIVRHGTPNRSMDRTADSRSVSVGRSTAVPDPRSRCDLRQRHRRNHEGDGHRRSGDRAAITLAKSVCGAANRIDSPGVPGSHDRMERAIVVSDSAQLFSLL